MRFLSILILFAVGMSAAGCGSTTSHAPPTGITPAFSPNSVRTYDMVYRNGLSHPMKSAYNGTFCILPYKPLKPLTEAGGRFEVTLERLADNICEKARFYVKFTDLTTHAWLDVEWYQPDRHSPWDVRVSNRHPNVMVFCWHQYGFKTLMKIVDQNVPNACQGYRRELR